MIDLFSAAHFSGLNADPNAFGLHNVLHDNGLVRCVVQNDVHHFPMTVIKECSSIVPKMNGMTGWHSWMTCFMFVSCLLAPMLLGDSLICTAICVHACESAIIFPL